MKKKNGCLFAIAFFVVALFLTYLGDEKTNRHLKEEIKENGLQHFSVFNSEQRSERDLIIYVNIDERLPKNELYKIASFLRKSKGINTGDFTVQFWLPGDNNRCSAAVTYWKLETIKPTEYTAEKDADGLPLTYWHNQNFE